MRSIMSQIHDEVMTANASYAEDFGDKANLPMPPGRHFAILTCMDARLDLLNMLDYPKETHMSLEMLVAGQVTMPFAH
jgi:carbonic anhydrase